MKLPKATERRLWRTIIEFEMLAPHDRVLVGLSGGKDSSFLVYALVVLRPHAPVPFDLAAIHVDQGFVDDFNVEPMEKFCRDLDVPFHVRRTSIFKAAFNHDRQNPCAQCSYLRRAFINDFAVRGGFNKVALAHHLDDAVETFLMSQLYTGQIKTFQPRSYLDRTKLTVIRPLVYFREKEISRASSLTGYIPVETPCPMSGKSMRSAVKSLVGQLCGESRYIFDNLVAAMREGTGSERWPARLGKEELRHKNAAFWQGRQESLP